MYKAEINEIFRLLKMSINTSLKILTELKELQTGINTVYDGVEDRFTNKIKKYNKKNKIMTIKDVCEYSTLSMSTVRRAFKTKELKYTTVIRLSDNALIPMNNNNKDYQEVLQWVAEGNTIEEAD